MSSPPSRSLLVLAALLVAGEALSATIHVDAAARPGGDGTASAPFDRIEPGLALAAFGDVVQLAPGVYDETISVTVNGFVREAVVILADGVTVQGAGRGVTFLRGAPEAFYGITAEGVGRQAAVRDLTLDGFLVQAVNLRGASPTLERVEIRNEITGASSVSLDARDGSFPQLVDCVLDGGHNGLFVEFGSGGSYRRCRLGRRPYETLSVVGSTPVLEDCVLEGGGRTTVVLSQDAQPVLTRCQLGRGDVWTVRVVGYSAVATVDLSSNSWFTTDVEAIRDSILDAEDQASLVARVNFLPLAPVVPVEDLSVGSLKRAFAPRPGINGSR